MDFETQIRIQQLESIVAALTQRLNAMQCNMQYPYISEFVEDDDIQLYGHDLAQKELIQSSVDGFPIDYFKPSYGHGGSYVVSNIGFLPMMSPSVFVGCGGNGGGVASVGSGCGGIAGGSCGGYIPGMRMC
jgi:hypothetical protein